MGTEDLSNDKITDDTWAVVCHMLRRCLSVRRLPSVTEAVKRKNASESLKEDEGLINEFIMEEELLSGRRYICCNATMVIGTLLCDRDYAVSIGQSWFFFLVKGLAKGIQDWEEAANIMGPNFNFEDHKDKRQALLSDPSPPHYLENALYGVQWMAKLLLLLASDENEVADENLAKALETLIQEQTQTIIKSFLEKESKMDAFASASADEDLILGTSRAGELGHLTQVVCDLLEGLNKLENKKFFKLAWLCPLLSSLINSNNKAVRSTVQGLVSRMFAGPMSSN